MNSEGLYGTFPFSSVGMRPGIGESNGKKTESDFQSMQGRFQNWFVGPIGKVY